MNKEIEQLLSPVHKTKKMTKNKKGQEEYPEVKQSKHQTLHNTYDPFQIPDQQ